VLDYTRLDPAVPALLADVSPLLTITQSPVPCGSRFETYREQSGPCEARMDFTGETDSS
jgi:hypothetical protein